MSFRTLQYILGAVVVAIGVAMIPAAVVAGIYQEWADMVEILIAALLTIVIGGVAWKYGKQAQLTTKEGFAIVGLAWILVVLFDEHSSLGLVRLRVKKATTDLTSILQEIESREPSPETSPFGGESPFAAITDEDIDSLFS